MLMVNRALTTMALKVLEMTMLMSIAMMMVTVLIVMRRKSSLDHLLEIHWLKLWLILLSNWSMGKQAH